MELKEQTSHKGPIRRADPSMTLPSTPLDHKQGCFMREGTKVKYKVVLRKVVLDRRVGLYGSQV